jgi:hypothetical protein
MLASEIKLYLDKHLKKPSLDYKWTTKENEAFFSFLEKEFPQASEDPAFAEIAKQTFKEFFEPVGYILFQYKEKTIRLKVFPYKTAPQESKILPSLVAIIQENGALVDKNTQKNQITLSQELHKKLYECSAFGTQEEVNTKELLKHAVRVALELKESDIIIVKADQIFVRVFDDSKKRELTKEEENTVAGRFNGIDEYELNSFYDDYFLQESDEDFFDHIAEIFVDRYFIQEQIDNLVYEKFVFGYIQMIIIEQLESMYDHNRAFFKGFSGYVFRKHFKEVFSRIADLVLSEIVNANKYMVEFLKYYSLNIVIVNGVKYKVPELQAPDGLRWNVVSMLSVVKLYVTTLEKVNHLKNEAQRVENEILRLYIGEYSPAEYNDIYMREKQKLIDAIARLTIKYNKVFDAYEVEQNEEKQERLGNEIDRIKREIEGLRDRKTNFLKKALKKEILTKYYELEKQFEALERDIKREERILAQNEDSYRSIKGALTKALISKKQAL